MPFGVKEALVVYQLLMRNVLKGNKEYNPGTSKHKKLWQEITIANQNPYYWHVRTIANEPKAGIKLLLFNYLLPEFFVLASARIIATPCFLILLL